MLGPIQEDMIIAREYVVQLKIERYVDDKFIKLDAFERSFIALATVSYSSRTHKVQPYLLSVCTITYVYFA